MSTSKKTLYVVSPEHYLDYSSASADIDAEYVGFIAKRTIPGVREEDVADIVFVIELFHGDRVIALDETDGVSVQDDQEETTDVTPYFVNRNRFLAPIASVSVSIGSLYAAMYPGRYSLSWPFESVRDASSRALEGCKAAPKKTFYVTRDLARSAIKKTTVALTLSAATLTFAVTRTPALAKSVCSPRAWCSGLATMCKRCKQGSQTTMNKSWWRWGPLRGGRERDDDEEEVVSETEPPLPTRLDEANEMPYGDDPAALLEMVERDVDRQRRGVNPSSTAPNWTGLNAEDELYPFADFLHNATAPPPAAAPSFDAFNTPYVLVDPTAFAGARAGPAARGALTGSATPSTSAAFLLPGSNTTERRNDSSIRGTRTTGGPSIDDVDRDDEREDGEETHRVEGYNATTVYSTDFVLGAGSRLMAYNKKRECKMFYLETSDTEIYARIGASKARAALLDEDEQSPTWFVIYRDEDEVSGARSSSVLRQMGSTSSVVNRNRCVEVKGKRRIEAVLNYVGADAMRDASVLPAIRIVRVYETGRMDTAEGYSLDARLAWRAKEALFRTSILENPILVEKGWPEDLVDQSIDAVQAYSDVAHRGKDPEDVALERSDIRRFSYLSTKSYAAVFLRGNTRFSRRPTKVSHIYNVYLNKAVKDDNVARVHATPEAFLRSLRDLGEAITEDQEGGAVNATKDTFWGLAVHRSFLDHADVGAVQETPTLNLSPLFGTARRRGLTNMQIRSEPAVPRVCVSPWANSSIEPDVNQRPLFPM